VTPIQRDIGDHHHSPPRNHTLDAATIGVRTAMEGRFETPEEQPINRSIPRVKASFGASWDFSSNAARAGDSVNELNAEITVEIATVSANCL